MTSAASHALSMAVMSGAISVNSGEMSNQRGHNTFNNATEVREPLSSAIERTFEIGFRLNKATDATGPSDAMATPGTIRYAGPRRYSMDGISPTST